MARAARTAKAELDKMSRRLARQWAAKQRTPDEPAQCGIRRHCHSPRGRDRGCYWTHCHACGQALVYTSDPDAKPQHPRKWDSALCAHNSALRRPQECKDRR